MLMIVHIDAHVKSRFCLKTHNPNVLNTLIHTCHISSSGESTALLEETGRHLASHLIIRKFLDGVLMGVYLLLVEERLPPLLREGCLSLTKMASFTPPSNRVCLKEA